MKVKNAFMNQRKVNRLHFYVDISQAHSPSLN